MNLLKEFIVITAKKKYVLREVKSNLEFNDISLNRCAIENSGFLPEMFKLGNPTPGEDNDCTGPHFILEDNIPNLTTSPAGVHMSYSDDNDYAFDHSCSSLYSFQIL